MTYLTSAQVKEIVHLAAFQIRLFLANSKPEDFKGDSKNAILEFHQNPGDFSDESLLEKGANVDDAHQYSVRIELRGVNPKGAAQVVAKGIWGTARKKAIYTLRKELSHHSRSPVVTRMAGSSSFEFNRLGVDKSLPLRYLRSCFESILDQMNYTPGNIIDSRQSRIVVAADGDGTIYDGPKTTHLPLLKDSLVFEPILHYLQAGGIFMLVSGNDLNRTFKRLIEGMPPEVYSRLLLAANGGADLAYANSEGKPVFVADYRQKALETAENDINKPLLDIIYFGDDGSPDGNDHAAFKTVGPNRSILVNSLQDTKIFLEKWMHERKIYPV